MANENTKNTQELSDEQKAKKALRQALEDELDDVVIEYLEAKIDDLRWDIRISKVERLNRLGRLHV